MKLKISNKLRAQATEEMKQVQNRLQYGFDAFGAAMESVQQLVNASEATGKGSYKAICYSDKHGYDSIHTYSKNVVKCIAIIQKGVIKEVHFERAKLGGRQSAYDTLWTQGEETRYYHLAKFLGKPLDYMMRFDECNSFVSKISDYSILSR